MKLLVCVGPRCDAEGRGSALLARLRLALAERFSAEIAAGQLKCETRECLRLCTRDPIVRIEPSGEAFSNPDTDALLHAVAEELNRSPDPSKKGPACAGPVGSEDGR